MPTPLVPIFAVVVRHIVRNGQPLTLSVHADLVAARNAARASIRSGVHAHVENRMAPVSGTPCS